MVFTDYDVRNEAYRNVPIFLDDGNIHREIYTKIKEESKEIHKATRTLPNPELEFYKACIKKFQDLYDKGEPYEKRVPYIALSTACIFIIIEKISSLTDILSKLEGEK